MNSVIAHVGHSKGHVPGQLLLDTGVVLDHIGALPVVVDEGWSKNAKNVWLIGVPHRIGDGQWEPRVVTCSAARDAHIARARGVLPIRCGTGESTRRAIR